MPSAIAAEVVVLPTPPEPAADADLLALRASRRSQPPLQLGRQPLELLAAQLRLEDARQRRHRRARRSPQPAHLGVLGARPRGAPTSAASRAARATRLPPVAPLERRDSSAPEARRVHRVHDDRVDAMPSSRSSARSNSTVSFTGISSGSAAVEHAGVRRVAQERSIRSAWRPTGPTRAMLANVLGARSIASPCPVAGASTIARSNAAPPVRALELREVPDLPDRHELGEPGRRGREVLEQAAAAEHARERARLQLVARATPASPRSGSTDDRGRARGTSSRACGRWPATSHSTTRLPRRAAARPSATARVVFPTPPLPVTRRSRLSSSADTGREG